MTGKGTTFSRAERPVLAWKSGASALRRRPDLFDDNFSPLNALYTMVALGRAKKLKKRQGRAMVFKIK